MIISISYQIQPCNLSPHKMWRVPKPKKENEVLKANVWLYYNVLLYKHVLVTVFHKKKMFYSLCWNLEGSKRQGMGINSDLNT